MSSAENTAEARLVSRIAHGYGNRRSRIDRAVAADVDMIEADLRWDGRQPWVRHEHRLGRFPVLYNHRLHGIHREGPLAIPVGPHWFRADIHRITLAELMQRTSGKTGLMLDLKAGRYSTQERFRFARRVLDALSRAEFEGPLGFCGEWALLDAVREMRPRETVHYSVDSLEGWRQMESRIRAHDEIRGITLRRDLATADRARFLADNGVEFISWDVDTAEQADEVLALGAAGVIGDDLDVLRGLAGRKVAVREDD